MNQFIYCIGGQKCGSSSLHDMLATTDLFSVPIGKKELHIFDSPEYFSVDAGSYKQLFQSGKARYFCSCPSYLHFPGVPEKLKNFHRDDEVFIIILVRDPYDRINSQLSMNFNRNLECNNYYRLNIAEESSAENIVNYDYINRSLFFKNYIRYERIFGKDSIIVLNMDVLDSPEVISNELFDKFGIKLDELYPRHSNERMYIQYYSIRWLASFRWLRKIIPGFIKTSLKKQLREESMKVLKFDCKNHLTSENIVCLDSDWKSTQRLERYVSLK